MGIWKYIFCLIVLFFHTTCRIAEAQKEDSIKFKTEEINVFSNKISTSKYDSPVKVQNIDRVNIENKNGETLSDVLQLGGGVYIKSYGGSNSLNTISLNGLGAEHTLVLLDGFKMNSSQNNLIDLNTISKDNIESIEILNNGSSSIYGSGAMSGVVNIITKNNIAGDLKVSLNAQAGSYEQRKVYFGMDKNFSRFKFNLSVSKESSQNNYEYYFNNGIEKQLKERQNSSYDFSDYFLNTSYLLSNSSKLNYFSNYSLQLRNIPGIETGSAPSNTVQRDKNWNSVLSYENILSKHVSLKSQINYQNNLSDYYDNLITDSYYKNIYLANSSQLNYVNSNFELAGGYDINYSVLKSNEVEDNVYRIQPGIFLVSKIYVNEFVKIYPSVRYDYISGINKNVISGMLGLNVKPLTTTNLNFKINVGNNFAAPTFNELYWKGLGNTSLKPESSVNLDAGVIYGFNFISHNSVEVTYSYIDATNKIVWSPNSNGQWTPKNTGKSLSNSILIDGHINKKFSEDVSMNVNLNYSYTQSKKKSKDYENDPTYNKQTFYIPLELAKCNLGMKYKGTGVNLFYVFTGKRYTNFENTEYLKAVDILEGNIYQNLSINEINIQLKLEINNILNTDYQMISGYPMPLRNYKMSLSLDY